MKTSIDSKQTILIHRQKILTKSFLNLIYRDFYRYFMVKKLEKPIIELGSGGGFIKKLYPKIITSDVVSGPGIDKVFSATKIPFKSNSVGGFVMLDTFHHIKDPGKALQEMDRCLKKGGKIVMIEPFNTLIGRFFYLNFHSEGFDTSTGWEIKGKGRLSDANNALAWIIFVRDRKIFEQRFPNLKIIKVEPHTPLKYLISGGLNRSQFLPTSFYGLIVLTEKILTPLNNFLALFVTIELEKI